jgi:hypothetical protein
LFTKEKKKIIVKEEIITERNENHFKPRTVYTVPGFVFSEGAGFA